MLEVSYIKKICVKCHSIMEECISFNSDNIITCPICGTVNNLRDHNSCPICFGSIINLPKSFLCFDYNCISYTINLMSSKPTLFHCGSVCAYFKHERNKVTYCLHNRNFLKKLLFRFFRK